MTRRKLMKILQEKQVYKHEDDTWYLVTQKRARLNKLKVDIEIIESV